jgi:hypothetical protein
MQGELHLAAARVMMRTSFLRLACLEAEMTHPLVDQLRFARSEFRRGLTGVTEEEARQRFMPMNCIGWMVGHLAHQEQNYWLKRAQDKPLAVPELAAFGFGKPASTPSLREMWTAYSEVLSAVDPWLDSLKTEEMLLHLEKEGKVDPESLGTQILRVTYHNFFHTGESQAVRQLLGHTNLEVFIGNIGGNAPYALENPRIR